MKKFIFAFIMIVVFSLGSKTVIAQESQNAPVGQPPSGALPARAPAQQVQAPPQAQAPPQGNQALPNSYIPPSGAPPGIPPGNLGAIKAQMPPPFPPRSLPPAIFIRGKEGNINRVFVEDATVGKEVRVEFIMFDIDPNEKLSPPKTYGLPAGASFKVETMEIEKNRAAGVLTWTPAETDTGLHAIAVEVSNSKGEPNRVALFYNVKK